MSTPTDRGPDGRGHPLATGALVLLPVLCCTGPALLGAGALAALDSWLLTPWLLLAAAVLAVLAVVGWRLRRRAGAVVDLPCCPPIAAGPRSSIHHQER